MKPASNTRFKTWVESAADGPTDFPLQNLPFGVFIPEGKQKPRIGVAIGAHVLDLKGCDKAGVLQGLHDAIINACREPTLNSLMGLGPKRASQLRRRIQEILRYKSRWHKEGGRRLRHLLHPMSAVRMCLPAVIGDYTDFYASIHHATNVGSMFRPDNPLLPNYKYVPVGYHGRSSSIVVSGTPVKRPSGQIKDDTSPAPVFGPTRQLDYELEMGIFVGKGNSQGTPVSIDDAPSHMFGVCLVNDWSARDIQKWEYVPLGPFLAKNFATTISPWVVTMEALAPFAVPVVNRAGGDPAPLPYLSSAGNHQSSGYDITVEAHLLTDRMKKDGMAPHRLSRGNVAGLYWTVAQLLTHHTSNGCNLRPGDLLGSGTISGNAPDSRGCLLELAWRGKEPVQLPSGEARSFLEDGDEVIMSGYCEKEGQVRIGLGECRGKTMNNEE